MRYTLHHGDCLDVLRELPAESVDAVVTDPPAGIAFMGKAWDRDKGGRDQWIAWMTEVAAATLAACKPGAHALVWALPRTSHWTATAWEDAGWEVRDRVSHLFGTGFPKSLDVGKAIDKAAGAAREKVPATGGLHKNANLNDDGWSKIGTDAPTMDGPIPATDLARQWDGWGTALKPACEDWWLLRKPLVGTVAATVAEHGTGAINIDGCRITGVMDGSWGGKQHKGSDTFGQIRGEGYATQQHSAGRWPANVIHDGSEEVLEEFPQTARSSDTLHPGTDRGSQFGQIVSSARTAGYADTGTAARFFYCAKASRAERGEGNSHPTVKPLALMRYLCRLITPPGGTVLDPFAGSGSTGVGALAEGFRFIGIEREAEYVEIAARRLAHAARRPPVAQAALAL